MPEYNPTLVSKFWSQVNKNGPVVRPELGPCWLWTGCCFKSGYGAMSIPLGDKRWRTEYTHRMGWILQKNEQILAGNLICHHCDIRACVRGAHLFQGSLSDNNRDMLLKGRARGPSRLTEAQVLEIRERCKDKTPFEKRAIFIELSRVYGVKHKQLSRIVLNQRWKWL